MDITEQLTHESRIALAAAAEITRLRAEVEALKATLTQQCKGYRADVEKLEAEVDALRADADKFRALIAGVPLPPKAITYEHGWELIDRLQAAAVDAARAAQGGKT